MQEEFIKCLNSLCPLKDECLRHVKEADPLYQRYYHFENTDDISCKHLVKIKEFFTEEF